MHLSKGHNDRVVRHFPVVMLVFKYISSYPVVNHEPAVITYPEEPFKRKLSRSHTVA